jgi:hypothetical protein
MLIRFRVENFRSIKDEQDEASLVRVPAYDLDLLRTAGIYGPNASGKSTVVEALGFVQLAVRDSQIRWEPQGEVPRTPFAFHPACVNLPSLFAADLLLDGVRYEYGFVADTWRILEEWLFAWPRGRRQEWFTRDVTRDEEFVFSRLLTGGNRAITALTRPNSLFLSAAAQNNHEMLSPVHRWFTENLLVASDRMRRVLTSRVSRGCRDAGYREQVYELLRNAGLGISGLEDDAPEAVFQDQVVRFLRGDADVRLLHRTTGGTDVALPFFEESAGTRALFALAGAIVEALASGGTLVVDELDRSLHPHLSTHLVRTFNDPAANPRNAQLIFNTHDTNLLDAGILRRDQVWFTERADDGATHLFPLTDFRARKYENLERGYLQGRYGAVPAVGTASPLLKTGS